VKVIPKVLRRHRKISGMALALMLSIGMWGTAATPGYAATETTLVHQCLSVVNDGNTKGVFCIDVIRGGVGGADVFLRVEAICEYDSTGVTTQCSNVHLANYGWVITETLRDPPEKVSYGLQQGCGHGQSPYPFCVASGRNYFSGPGIGLSSQCGKITASMWPGDNINLPGTNKIGGIPQGGFSTAHIVVC
jgi:hypothetical protein